MDTAGQRWRAALPEALAAETMVGAVVGTPGYLSPEQAEGAAATEASDVWSLGVVLHELLSGARAFRGASPRDILVQVRQGRLPPLPDDTPAGIAPLRSVLGRATAFAPAARFADAKELADELTRFLEGGRVEVHDYSPVELLQATLRAWRAPLFVGGVLLLAAAGGIGLSLRSAREEAAHAARAGAAARAAQADADRNLQQALISQARTAAGSGDRGRAETLAAHALALGEAPRARGILLDGRPRPTHLGASAAPLCDASDLDPRGRWLACQQGDALSLWDLEAGEEVWTRDAPSAGRPRVDAEGWVSSSARLTDHVLLDRRGHLIAAVHGFGAPTWLPGEAGLALIKDGLTVGSMSDLTRRHACRDGSADAHTRGGGAIVGVCFGEVFVWRGAGVQTFPTAPLTAERGFPRVVAADDTRVIWGSETGHLVAHALPDGAPLWQRRLPIGAVRDLVVSPDGARLAVLGTHLGVHVLDTATGDTGWVLPELPRQRAVGIAGDGAGVSVLDWGTSTWRPIDVPISGTVKSVDHTPDPEGALLIGLPTHVLRVGGDARGAGPWNVGSRRIAALAGGLVAFASYSRNGPGLMRTGGQPAPSIALIDHPVADLEAAPDGEHAVWATVDGVWELTLPDLETRLALPLPGATVAARSADHIAGAGRARLAVVPRDAGGPGAGWSRDDLEDRVLEIRLSPDGRRVVTGHADGSVRIFDVHTGALLAVLPAHVEQVPALAIHPTEPRLVTGSWDRTVRVWDLDTLDQPAPALLAQVREAWGLSLEHALR